MVSITPQGFFAVLAIIVAIGFGLDYFFHRTRITSILPLMLLGLVFVQTGVFSPTVTAELTAISGFVSAIAVAMVLFLVGLQIDLVRLYKVLGRASAWTLVCQTLTGVALSLLTLYTFQWPVLWCFVFGFAVSGPSSIVVQALVTRLVMKEELKTTVLFESVITDVLQLVIPTLLITVYLQGSVSGAQVAGLVSAAVFGSIGLGVAVGLVWVWALDKGRSVASGYTWALSIVVALGLYSVTVYASLSGALTIFLFGLIVGNAAILDARRGTNPADATSGVGRLLARLRRFMRLSSETVDIEHIRRIQQEVTYIVGTFFFFYLGVLFVAPAPEFAYIIPVVAMGVILGIRFGLVPILSPLLDPEPSLRRNQRALIVMNIPRGLSAAVVAGLVVSLPGVLPTVPGFVDAMFMVILLSNVVATIGIFLFYRPAPQSPKAALPEPMRPALSAIPSGARDGATPSDA